MRTYIVAAIVFFVLSFSTVEAFTYWEASDANPAMHSDYTVLDRYARHDEEKQWLPQGAIARENSLTELVYVHEVEYSSEADFEPWFESTYLKDDSGKIAGSEAYIAQSHEVEPLPEADHYRIITTLTLDVSKGASGMDWQRVESLSFHFTLQYE